MYVSRSYSYNELEHVVFCEMNKKMVDFCQGTVRILYNIEKKR